MTTKASENLSLDFTCGVCFKPYDFESRLPKSLPCCSKTLCRKCLQGILRNGSCECLWCKSRMASDSEAFKTNLQVLSALEEDFKWDECMTYLKNFTNERVMKLKDNFVNAEDPVKKCGNIIGKNRNICQKIINESFDKQIIELQKAKAKALRKLNFAFSGSVANNDFGLRAEGQDRTYEHLNFSNALSPLSKLQQEMSNLMTKADSLIGGNEFFEDSRWNIEQLLSMSSPLKLLSTLDLKADRNIGQKLEVPLENLVMDDEIHVQVSRLNLELHEGSAPNSWVFSCDCATDLHRKTVGFKLKDLKETNSAKITIGSPDLNEINLKALDCVFANLSKISKVFFFLEKPAYGGFPTDELSHLFSIIFARPQDLSSLSIFLPPNDDILVILNALMSQFSLVSDLKVQFFPGEWSTESLKEFAQNLSLLTDKLKKLDLNFSGTNFPISAFEKLFISMPNLEDLSLNVSRVANLNNLTLDMAMKNLKSLMPKLQRLSLNVSQTDVTRYFVSALKVRMNFIPQLSINVNGFTGFPSSDYASISRSLWKNSDEFRNVDFSYFERKDFDQKGVQESLYPFQYLRSRGVYL